MNGAERIFRVVRMAEILNLLGLTDDYRGYGVKALRRGRIVLVAGEHARGSTCHVFLESGDERLEVYGVVCGQTGWTEEYGWLKRGSWVDAIEKLLSDLELEIKTASNERQLALEQEQEQKARLEREQVARFNSLFE